MMQKTVPVHEPQSVAPKPEDADEIDLLEIARTLWRGKVWIIFCVALALSYGLYKAFIAAVPLYTARTEMALQLSSPPIMDVGAIVAGFSGDEASINTEMAIITSGEMVGLLVDELDLHLDPEFNSSLPDPEFQPSPLELALTWITTQIEPAIRSVIPDLPATKDEEAEPASQTAEDIRRDVIDEVREAIETQSSRGTYVFSILATTRDPDKSALIANTLGRLYRDDQIRLKVETTERLATWLADRVGELRAELDAREREISELRAQSSLVSDESLQALNAQAIALQAELEEVQGQLARTNESLEALQAADESGDVETRAAAAQDSQLDAAAAAIAASETGAQVRFDRRFAQLLQQTEVEQERLQEQVSDLQRTLNSLSAQFERQSADLLALQQLEQETEATQALYATFLTRLRETTVQQSAHEADSRLLTPADEGVQVEPRPARILALMLLLGLVAGAGIVLLREFLQNTFRTAEALEQHTGRPVLGQIPRIPARARADTIRYLVNKPTSAAAEAVRNLRTSILLSNVDNPPKVIMATSSIPNEGKTTLTISLAQNLAGIEKKVLLIEGDIRRRTFSNYFRQAKGKGNLLSVVSGKQPLEEAVFRPPGLDIDVLAGERTNINAADLFSSERFQQLIEQARQAYDYVIIDTPPVLVVPDARVIAQHADAVVYVIHWDATSRSQVEEGLRQFRSVNAPVTGLVLSRVDPKGMKRYGHAGSYGAYSRYGRRYYDA